MMLRRRTMVAAAKDDPFKDWVKIDFNLTTNKTDFYIVDGSTNRVPDAALAAIRLVVDGVEITPPIRQVDFEAGRHVAYYYIGNGQGTQNWWWYWVGNVTRITFPASYTTLTSSAVVLAALAPEMVFKCPHSPFVAGTTLSDYIKNRKIYVPSGSESEYSALGFTNIHTLDEL